MRHSYPALAALLAALALHAAAEYSYGGADLADEQFRLAALQNRQIRDVLCAFLNMKKAEPVLAVPGQFAFSIDLSCGAAIAPLYSYDAVDSPWPLFGPISNLYRGGLELHTAGLSFAAVLAADLLAVADFSFLPSAGINGATENNLKACASLYWRLLKDALMATGLYAGAGYVYCGGGLDRGLDLSAVIGGTNASYDGGVRSSWSYNGFSLRLFARNQLLFFNFSGRLDYYCLFGQVQTGFTAPGDGSPAVDGSPVQGLVLSAGMEAAIGWFKLNAEAGKDLLSPGMYVNAGLRFGY